MVTHYCPAQTFAGRMHVDPEPQDFCWNEVEEEGQFCPQHEEQDEDNPWGDD
jgi:hypothetical protein